MVGPDYKRPPPADPPSLDFKETTGPVVGAAASFQPAMPRDAIDRGPWWTMYGDPTLDRLAAQVDISNQTLMQAEAAYRQARALVRQDAVGPLSDDHRQRRLHPERQRLRLAAALSRARVVNASQGSVGQFNVGAVAHLGDRPVGPHPPPDRERFGGGPGQRRRPRQCAAVGAGQHGDQLFLACASPSSACGSTRRRWRPMRARCRSCRTRSMPASSRRVDLAQAQTQLEQTRAQLVAENITRAQFEHADRGAGRQGAVRAQRRARAGCRRQVPTVEPGVPSTLLERRPDIASAERQMAAANAQIGVAQAAYYPNISLASTVTLVGSSLNALLTLSNAVWSVGPQLAATLIDGGALQGPGRGRAGALRLAGRALSPDHPVGLPAGRGRAGAAARARAAGAGAARRRRRRARRRAAVAQPVSPRHRALHDGGADPDRGAVGRADPARRSASNRLTASANLVLALGGGWRDTDLPAPYADRRPQPERRSRRCRRRRAWRPTKPWWRFW